MRSAPASSWTWRNCGNRPSAERGCSPSWLSTNSISAKPAFSSVAAAASEQVSGCAVKRWAAVSMPRTICAATVCPTMSSAPATWCSCCRAARNWLASTEARSIPRACSASWAKRRSALVAAWIDLRVSSRTQARGPRSPAGTAEARAFSVRRSVTMGQCTPIPCSSPANAVGAATPAMFNPGDQVPAGQLGGNSYQLSMALRATRSR